MRWQWVLRVAALVLLGIAVCLALTRTSAVFTDYRAVPVRTTQAPCNSVIERWTNHPGYQASNSSSQTYHSAVLSANIACTAAIDNQQEWVVALGAVAVGLFASSFLVRRPVIAEATRQPSEAVPHRGAHALDD